MRFRIDMDTAKDAALLGVVCSITFLLLALGTLLFRVALQDREPGPDPARCECRR